MTICGMDSSHRRHDLRSLALHEAAVRVLREHPERAAHALEVLGRWEAQNSDSHSQALFDEWRRIIVARLWDIAVEDTDKGQQLRQASPMGFVLDASEREQISRRFRHAKTVLFLDVDGPLHPQGASRITSLGKFEGNGLFRWAPTLVSLLEELPHVDVVVHSSWRQLLATDDEVRALMPPELAALVVCCTPREVVGRYESIEEYVRREGVERYAILDDDPEWFPDGLKTLVVCSPDSGLSDPAVVQALRAALE